MMAVVSVTSFLKSVLLPLEPNVDLKNFAIAVSETSSDVAACAALTAEGVTGFVPSSFEQPINMMVAAITSAARLLMFFD